MEWVGIYKFARLALLALVLLGIAVWLYRPSQAKRFGRAVASRARHHFGSTGNRLNHFGDDTIVFVVGQRG